MRRILVSLILGALCCSAQAAPLPYDESANANADLQHALAAAQASHNDVLVVFGANWCPDCRELDKALKGRSQQLIAGKFQVVKVDVGRFDKNLDVANEYGNPIRMGIPAVVVLTADNKIVYSSKGGELANARKMGDTGIYDFLSSHVAPAH
ncbi:MAG TPA: thioredoxin family protein [Steroidobacteraceae bacterium]|jgi:protein disulfide-isomerase